MPAPGRTVSEPGFGTLVLIAVSVLGYITAVTMISPFLLDISREFGVTLGEAGLLGVATSLPWAIGAPFTGLLSDRVGRRPLIIFSLAAMGVACMGAALAPNFGLLVLARFFIGSFGAFGPASVMASIGDLFPPERRGRAMGWLNLGFGLAAIAGVPAVAVVGGQFGWRWGFVATGLILLPLAVIVRFVYPDRPPVGGSGGLRQTYAKVFRVPHLWPVLGANTLERSLVNACTLYLAPFLMLSYGLTVTEVATPLALSALGGIAGAALGGPIADRFPRSRVFVIAQLLSAALLSILFGTSPSLVVSVTLGVVFGLVSSMSRPSFLALGSELSPPQRGAVLGLFSATNNGGAALGSGVAGAVIGAAGYPGLAITLGATAIVAAASAIPLVRGHVGDARR